MDEATRFVVDGMLGSLARWQRILGYDTDYVNQRDDPELVRIARAENRVLLTRDRGPLLLETDDPSPGSWLDVHLVGKKVNRGGLGAAVEIASGGHYQRQTYAEPRAHFGLGDLETVDVVRVTWPNGVAQNVIQPAVNGRLEIEEKQTSARARPLERELEWVRLAPRARQAKSKARLRAYEKLVAEEQQRVPESVEISIPPGQRTTGMPSSRTSSSTSVRKPFSSAVAWPGS